VGQVEPAAATIFFTTDGSQPTTASRKYTAPFELLEGGELTTVRAFGVLEGYKDSRVSSALYTHLSSGASSASGETPDWVPALIGGIGGLICVCCLVAAVFQWRLRRIVHKIEDEEAHLRDHHHHHHRHRHGADGVSVHVHTLSGNPHAPGTHLAEGAGVLRPITDSQLMGMQVCVCLCVCVCQR